MTCSRNTRIRKFVAELVFNCKHNYYFTFGFKFAQKNMLFYATTKNKTDDSIRAV